jgi:hypothetical protein
MLVNLLLSFPSLTIPLMTTISLIAVMAIDTSELVRGDTETIAVQRVCIHSSPDSRHRLIPELFEDRIADIEICFVHDRVAILHGPDLASLSTDTAATQDTGMEPGYSEQQHSTAGNTVRNR